MIDKSFLGIEEKRTKWLMQRWGKFTASEIHKLTSKGMGEMFGAGAKSYIKNVARKSYTDFNTDEDVETRPMKNGKLNEPLAFGEYKKRFGLDFTYYGDDDPYFQEYGEDAGCSPDSVLYKPGGEVSWGTDFKCPNGDTHMEYLFSIGGHSDLKKVHNEYYCQCQFSMICFDCDVWHWVSYNQYFPKKEKMLIIEIPQDKSYQENLLIRLDCAIKIKNRIIEQRKNGYKGEITFK